MVSLKRPVQKAPSFKNGESFHTDWFGAWDYNVMKTWMKRCNGIADIDGSSGTDNWHECSDSEFGDGTQGVVQQAAPDGTRTGGVSQTQSCCRCQYTRIALRQRCLQNR
jgi:hypothetical protein